MKHRQPRRPNWRNQAPKQMIRESFWDRFQFVSFAPDIPIHALIAGLMNVSVETVQNGDMYQHTIKFNV